MKQAFLAVLTAAAFLLTQAAPARAGLIGDTIKVEFIPGVDPGQYQSFTGTVTGSFTFDFPVYSVNYGNLFIVSIDDTSITLSDVNSQAFVWETGDHFQFTILSGGQVHGVTLQADTFPGITSANVGFTPSTITLTTPPGGLLTNGDSLTIHVSTPEPASIALFSAMGLVGLVYGLRRRSAGRKLNSHCNATAAVK